VHDVGFIVNVGVALLAALIGGSIAHALKLPVLIGYLVAGLVVGPYTPGITARPEVVHSVANLGVALLMYAVGVHFSLEQLRAVWRSSLIGGGLQIVGTVVLGTLVGLALGWGTYGGLFLGCAISLSSTAVMTKILEERGETDSAHGKVMLGVLITQDLCLVLIAPVLIAMGTGVAATSTVARALVVGGLLLALTLLLAMRIVPAVMKWVTRTKSQELFTLTAVGICIVAAVMAEKAGLGMALGAFLAGLVISETDYAHELFSQIRPLRDVFAAVFFVSVGMLLDPKFLLANWVPILAVVLAIVLGKALIAALSIRVAGESGQVALFAGLGLAQIGEFSFVLAGLGSDRKLIPAEVSGVVLAAAVITLLLAPFVYQLSTSTHRWSMARRSASTKITGKDAA